MVLEGLCSLFILPQASRDCPKALSVVIIKSCSVLHLAQLANTCNFFVSRDFCMDLWNGMLRLSGFLFTAPNILGNFIFYN